jgi:hypothetical protein
VAGMIWQQGTPCCGAQRLGARAGLPNGTFAPCRWRVHSLQTCASAADALSHSASLTGFLAASVVHPSHCVHLVCSEMGGAGISAL